MHKRESTNVVHWFQKGWLILAWGMKVAFPVGEFGGQENGCQQSQKVGKVCKMKNEIVSGVVMPKYQRWLNLREVNQKVFVLVCRWMLLLFC